MLKCAEGSIIPKKFCYFLKKDPKPPISRHHHSHSLIHTTLKGKKKRKKPNSTSLISFTSSFSFPNMELPVIDLSPYLAVSGDRSSDLAAICSEVSRNLTETGALLIKDPRCSVEDNDRFIDMMERYFQSPHDFKRRQERPHLHYQVSNSNWVCLVA